VAKSLQDSKTVMQLYRNRAVPSGVLTGKRELYNKEERMAASREKRKIVCIPTPKVLKYVSIKKTMYFAIFIFAKYIYNLYMC
jgi:hypothetical protein